MSGRRGTAAAAVALDGARVRGMASANPGRLARTRRTVVAPAAECAVVAGCAAAGIVPSTKCLVAVDRSALVDSSRKLVAAPAMT